MIVTPRTSNVLAGQVGRIERQLTKWTEHGRFRQNLGLFWPMLVNIESHSQGGVGISKGLQV